MEKQNITWLFRDVPNVIHRLRKKSSGNKYGSQSQTEPSVDGTKPQWDLPEEINYNHDAESLKKAPNTNQI